MTLTIIKDTIFKARVVFTQDGSSKEISFRLPRSKDFHTSADGNTTHNSMMTICNMALPFEEPVMVADENGQAVPIYTLKSLYELDIDFTIDDIMRQWKKTSAQAAKSKEDAVKKLKSAGSSTQKDTPETPLAD